MAVQRIHQQPFIGQRPRSQNGPAFIHESSQRNPFGMFFEGFPNQTRGIVNKAAGFRQELRHLRTVVCRPVSGINPVNFERVEHL